MLTKKQCETINNTAYFISIISSTVFATKYLEKRVRNGTLAGLAYESPTLRRVKVNIFTPPSFAWYSKEALTRCYDLWTNTIIAAAQGKAINVVG